MSGAAEPAVALAAELDGGGLTAAAPAAPAMTGVAAERWVRPDTLVAAAQVARRGGWFFESLTCVDRIDPHGVFELVYTFNRYEARSCERVALRVWAPQDEPLPSLCGVYGIAEWNEREAWEFYGLRFTGNPHLTWLLLPEGTEFHPLLKSFTAPPPSIYDDSMSADAGAPRDG